MARLTKLEQEHIQKIKDVYHKGGTDIEICKALGITPRDLDNLQKDPLVAEALEMGRVYAHAWWLERGRQAIDDTKFNTTLWMFHMKNRYGWADKSENVNVNSNEPKSLDEAALELEKLIPGLLKKVRPHLAGMSEAELLEHTSGHH